MCLWLKQATKQKGKYCSHPLSINVEQDGAECCGTGTRELLLKVFTRIWTISLPFGLEFTEAGVGVLMSTLTGGLSRFSWSSNIETFTHNLVLQVGFKIFQWLPGETLATGLPDPDENVTKLLELLLIKILLPFHVLTFSLEA